jgi:hypothetical protein
VIAHLIASIGDGDPRLSHSVLAVFQTFGFFVTILDLPFRWSAWQALGGAVLLAVGLRREPAAVERTLELLERGMDAEAMPDIDRVWSVIPSAKLRKILLVPLLPLILISGLLRVVLFLWTALFLGPPLALIWRARRYAADAAAVRLTRNPDGLARALTRIGGGAVPAGGEGREYCFIHVSVLARKGGFAERRTTDVSLYPSLDRRLRRLNALGAQATGWRGGPSFGAFLRRDPGKALLVLFLLSLLVPLGVILVLAVAWLTAMAMTVALAGGLTLAAALLG